MTSIIIDERKIELFSPTLLIISSLSVGPFAILIIIEWGSTVGLGSRVDYMYANKSALRFIICTVTFVSLSRRSVINIKRKGKEETFDK